MTGRAGTNRHMDIGRTRKYEAVYEGSNIMSKELDWEMEEFMNPDPNKKELKLEDFQVDEEPEGAGASGNERLQKVAEEVRAVKALMEEGRDSDGIARELGMAKERVMLIQMNMYGGEGDDNELAVAHMVMMEDE